ncbi:hypothetical protein TSST111916_10000 [Tsukamurella strandjordii]|uniref:hypothetical protein n=1 Tax=Tsukamurella TaxID=2060 RepID=UPI001C7DEFE5|nr:hypothetical protein [Tsukamurella sp. TY48]GIZ98049.1 hypothetical protein TTY48_26610 [Tsukamurella sp. TY48]
MNIARTIGSAGAASLVAAGLLTAPAHAEDPVAQTEVCRAYPNAILVTAGQAWRSGTDGKPVPVPEQMAMSVSRSATLVPPPPGSNLDVTVDWRNTRTGATGTLHQVGVLGSGGGSTYFPFVATGAGAIEIKVRATANIGFPLPGSCQGTRAVR